MRIPSFWKIYKQRREHLHGVNLDLPFELLVEKMNAEVNPSGQTIVEKGYDGKSSLVVGRSFRSVGFYAPSHQPRGCWDVPYRPVCCVASAAKNDERREFTAVERRSVIEQRWRGGTHCDEKRRDLLYIWFVQRAFNDMEFLQDSRILVENVLRENVFETKTLWHQTMKMTSFNRIFNQNLYITFQDPIKYDSDVIVMSHSSASTFGT